MFKLDNDNAAGNHLKLSGPQLIGIILSVTAGFILLNVLSTRGGAGAGDTKRLSLRPGLNVSVASDVFAGTTQPAQARLVELSQANDAQGVTQMALAGQAVRFTGGTVVRVLTVDGRHAEVRALNGPSVGKSGWVRTDLLRE